MPNQDFLRRLPESDRALRRRERLQQRIHVDFWLLLLLLIITAGGLVVLYSASDQSIATVKRQGIYFFIAYVAMFVVAQVPVHFMRRLAPWAYVVAVGLLVLVIFHGVGAKGAQRWLSLGGFRFQPSELMKLAMPVAIAAYLGQRHLPPSFKHIFWTLVFVSIPVVLIVKQPDLGTAILVAASGLMVLFYAGISWRYLLAALGAGLLSLWPLWHFVLHDYQKRRVLTLLNPEADRLGAGWNIIQSKTAIGSGRGAGQRLAAGHPVAPGFSARRPHRFYYRRSGRRVWLYRGFALALSLPFGDSARSDHRPARPGKFWPPPGREYYPDVFCLCLCQYRHGVGTAAGRGRSPATDQPGGDFPGYSAGRFWYFNGYSH